MRSIVVSALAAGALVVGGSAMLAAPDQGQPGQMTQARVWVMNSGRTEAVPVNLRDATLDAPLRVQIVQGGEPRVPDVVKVHLARQAWEYMTLTIPTNAKPAPVVDQQGAAGWETTGIAWTTPDGTTLLMKRPR
ncbi:MAG: hypothetical protein HY048_16885 [Acidobacteria bacterium]|nr:hypothetical protein [Acidobacteriota bacterium]